MKAKKIIRIVLLACIQSQFLFAQLIPDWRRIDWSAAGYEGEIPCYTNLRDAVVEFGMDNTGLTDNAKKINDAIKLINPGEVLYFPNGTYLIKTQINLKSNVVIRGESVTGTLLKFTFTQDLDCFSLVGKSTQNVTTITDPKTKDSYTVVVANTTGLAVGQLLEIEQENDTALHFGHSWNNADWAQCLKGQLVKITAVDLLTKTLTFDRPLSIDYDKKYKFRVHVLDPIKQVGIENLHMIRTDKTGGYNGNNIMMIYAQNCWVKGVHSEFTARYHFRLDRSTNLAIRDSYIENAYYWGAGGAAYGVMCADHTCNSLVENNIFRMLRHSLIVKEGANSNVYAYNYVYQSKWDGTDFPADISLHGHYAFENLFEGNVVRRGTISDSWGPTGPGNTFLRNRVEGFKNLWIQDLSHYQNFIANEFTFVGTKNKNPGIENDHDNSGVKGIIRRENRNVVGVDTLTQYEVPASYYLNAKPNFFGSMPWPNIGKGTTYGTGMNPAKLRWLTDSLNPIPEWNNCVITSMQTAKLSGVDFYPNPTNHVFTVHVENQSLINVWVYDALGKEVFCTSANANISFGENLAPGIYWVKIQQESNASFTYKAIRL